MFTFSIPKTDGQSLEFRVGLGETLFILGANGSGKSSLMPRLYKGYPHQTMRVSAQRQNWFSNDSSAISYTQKRSFEEHIRKTELEPYVRWQEVYADQRPGMALFDLVTSQNARSRSISDAVDAGDSALVERLKKTDAPIKSINELLRYANLPITISLGKNGDVLASKPGSIDYGVAQLSDGERNALLVTAMVLTARPDHVILIDEPERHLHRSVISPLLSALFKRRSDCAFIVSTHDVTLPVDNPESSILLIRDCVYNGDVVTGWDATLVTSHVQIDDEIKQDILGARRKVIFVEGGNSSLDAPLYSIILPGASVVAKEGCRDVQRAVQSIRESGDIHWVKGFGIIDNDGRTEEDITALKAKGIYALPVHSVESIYYHPAIQERLAALQAKDYSYDKEVLLQNARSAVLTEVEPQILRLSRLIAEKTVQDEMQKHKPSAAQIAAMESVSITIDIPAIVRRHEMRLRQAHAAGDAAQIISLCPIKKTGIPDRIARELMFGNADKYQRRVLTLLATDEGVRDFVRSLFDTLPTDIGLA